MPIELYFSNQLDQLAEKFSDVLQDELQGRDNILVPSRVIVPNANLAKWLQLFVAARRTIFMNIEFQYLEAGLWEMLVALDGVDKPPQRMDKERLRILMLQLLQHIDSGDALFSPLTHYLLAEDNAPRPDEARRLWQLSEKLAHLFEEYEFHRSDMIRQWAAGEVIPHNEMEACQQELYQRARRLRDQLAGSDRSTDALHHGVCRKGFSKARKAAAASVREHIHFFGLSQISNFHLGLIGRLQDHYHIHIYTMNPCEEFWEDIKTPGEKRWLHRKNLKRLAIQPREETQGELFLPADNALLSAWGKPGREGIRLLCLLTDYDFNAGYTTARQPFGVLQRVQNDILTLSAATGERQLADQDRSLQIIACPGVYREVETIYNSILFNLHRDESLQLTDIAILVPDMATYKPVFDSVFNRYPRQITYNLVDSHADIESIYGKAVLAILKLAGGRFSRNEVFDLVLNPCFMERWKIQVEEVAHWVAWTHALNIFHDFDESSKVGRGYPAGRPFYLATGP